MDVILEDMHGFCNEAVLFNIWHIWIRI